MPAVGQRGRGAGERDEQDVAREADQPAAERDRGREHDLPGAAAYDEDREQRADRRAERVDDEVVDVEEPVGAGVEVPDAGLLGELDEQRQAEAGDRRDHHAAVQDHAEEVAERHEQQDVQHDLHERRFSEQRQRPAVLGHVDQPQRPEHPQLAALAPEGVVLRHRQQRVGPDRQRVDRRADEDGQVQRPEPAVEPVLHRGGGDQQQHREDGAEDDRDQSVGRLVAHGGDPTAAVLRRHGWFARRPGRLPVELLDDVRRVLADSTDRVRVEHVLELLAQHVEAGLADHCTALAGRAGRTSRGRAGRSSRSPARTPCTRSRSRRRAPRRPRSAAGRRPLR